MGVDKEYIIAHCQDKQRLYDIDICMLQTEPCKRAVEQNRCPKIWWEKGASDGETANSICDMWIPHGDDSDA